MTEEIKTFDDGKIFLDEYVKGKQYLYVTTVTYDYCDMAHNCFISLKNVNLDQNCLMVALDVECYNKLKELNIPCVLLNCSLKNKKTYKDYEKIDVYAKLTSTTIILETYKLDVIQYDIDMIFLKDPIELFREKKEQGYDIIVTSEKIITPFRADRKIIMDKKNENDHVINIYNFLKKFKNKDFNDTLTSDDIFELKQRIIQFGALQYIVSNEKNIKWSKIFKDNAYWFYKYIYHSNSIFEDENLLEKKINVNHLEDFCGDYKSLDEEINNHSDLFFYKLILNLGIKTTYLSYIFFPCGYVWFKPKYKEKIKDICYVVHYSGLPKNIISTNKQNKIEMMKEDGYWYI